MGCIYSKQKHDIKPDQTKTTIKMTNPLYNFKEDDEPPLKEHGQVFFQLR